MIFTYLNVNQIFIIIYSVSDGGRRLDFLFLKIIQNIVINQR